MKPHDIQSRRAGEPVRQGTGYWAFVPKSLPPELDYSPTLIKLLDEAAWRLGELAGLGRILPSPWLIVGPAVHREAVLSSRIEGTHTSVNGLYRYEAQGLEGVEAADAREVHNYVVALEYSVKRVGSLPVSLRFVGEIHERLMRGVRGGSANPGQFRTTQNWVGPPGATLAEAAFVPPPVPQMHEALHVFETYLHTETDTPALVRLALIHAQFEIVHPFADGNGRVGRLLIILLMVHWGLLPHPLLYLSAFFERHRDEYYRGLKGVSHEGRWEDWIELFLRGVREQAQDAVRLAEGVLALREKYRARLAGRRLSKITEELAAQVFVNPWVTAPAVRDRWKVNFRTAQKAIDDLARLKILAEATGKHRHRAWVAHEVMAIVSGEKQRPRTKR
ncbi:MAG TPA: Fic/DOC family N-terminal domain-containing protein [Burkholderiales bacterium]|nr:Fic/DOC family N-terminal domain-containing protein [Burkholderiales bacterium]